MSGKVSYTLQEAINELEAERQQIYTNLGCGNSSIPYGWNSLQGRVQDIREELERLYCLKRQQQAGTPQETRQKRHWSSRTIDRNIEKKLK